MRRLAWTFAARIGDKYQIRLTRSICSGDVEAVLIKGFYEQTMLSFAQKDSIKLERICEYESSSIGITAAALDKKAKNIYYHFTNTERAKRARKKNKKQQQQYVWSSVNRWILQIS